MASAAPAQTPQIALLYQRAVRKFLGSQSFALGGNDLRFELDQNGYLDMLRVQLVGSYAKGSGTSITKAQLPHAIVKKFLVDVPNRETAINLSGLMMHIFNLRSNDFGTFPAPGVPPNRTGDDANVLYAFLEDSFPVADSTSNAFTLNWIIPFHRSVVDHKGALPVGALPKVYLEVSPANTLADVVSDDSDTSAFTGTMTVEQISFSAPPSDAAVIPGSEGAGYVLKYDEAIDPIVQAGIPTKIPIDPSDIILAIIHSVSIDGVRDSVDVDRLYLKVAESYFTDPAGIPANVKTLDDAAEHGAPFPEGVFVWDQDLPATGMAGWIHTEGINRIEAGIVMQAGTVITGACSVRTGVLRLVQLPDYSAGAGA